MTHTKLLLSAALAGVMAASVAYAADDAAAPKVKCYGIAKAGKNACANATGSHGCQGMAKIDNDPNEFVEATAADCETQGGKTAAPSIAK